MWSFKDILKLVDDSKDMPSDEQVKIAKSMGFVVGTLYILEMKKRHNIIINR